MSRRGRGFRCDEKRGKSVRVSSKNSGSVPSGSSRCRDLEIGYVGRCQTCKRLKQYLVRHWHKGRGISNDSIKSIHIHRNPTPSSPPSSLHNPPALIAPSTTLSVTQIVTPCCALLNNTLYNPTNPRSINPNNLIPNNTTTSHSIG